MIRQSVLDAWHKFSEPLEGRVYKMYLDILGLVTTGVGNLIDTPNEAAKLPWKREDGTLATRAEVVAEWNLLKSRQDLKRLHYKYAAAILKLHLTDADIDALVASKLKSNAEYLTKHDFPAFPNWPADAQLGALSMAWAVGPGFARKFPNFARYAKANDWAGAQLACTIREKGNPGVVPRNKHNRTCFANAATVVSCTMDREVLHWPNIAEPPIESGIDAEKVLELVALTAYLDDDYQRDLRAERDSQISDTDRSPPPESYG